MSDEPRGFGYVIRWRNSENGWWTMNALGSGVEEITEASVMHSVALASKRFVSVTHMRDARIVRVRRVVGEDYLAPLGDNDRETYVVFDTLNRMACTAPGFGFEVRKRVPGESRWEVVDE